MFSSFHPAVASWFTETFGSATEPQLAGWPEIASGRHTLIAAPTGTGKTLAAFLASLDQLFRLGLEDRLEEATYVLYVSPLKALSNDIHKNLELPLSGIRASLEAQGYGTIEVRAAVRTGDTPAAERARMAKRPPHILVTTPESLYLLLTSDSGRRALSNVRTVIVDEIHALAGNRRGVHLALTLERLARLVGRPLQRIGLSATQKPLEEVGRFLVGSEAITPAGAPDCAIVDCTRTRQLDLAIEVPRSPLEAVMSGEVWEEIYDRIAALVSEHRTTLVFVNTRRLAERLTAALSERIGKSLITSHHGSLSTELRQDAERRLKSGELRALVATASLELGIDIGSVDLVCQIGTTRSIAGLLQRVGRARHVRGGVPKGRIFPTSRDELIECAALVRAARRGDLDRLYVPERPLDVLAQQIVAATSCEELGEEELFALVRRAYPYRELPRADFDAVVEMLTVGFGTRRGRRGSYLHHDAVNAKLRARRGARITALTNGGAIPENADYRVEVDPEGTYVGSVNEDFAVEAMAGDVFQLGNASWEILRVLNGIVRVRDAKGQPPSIPFWLGEAPARSDELSRAVSALRGELDAALSAPDGRDRAMALLLEEPALPREAALQIVDYLVAVRAALGLIPTQESLVAERFFDEAGGMQLVLHSPFGGRINRAWGLALRKRFCRSFNFELQAAATEDAIVLSLGEAHSFPLEDVFHFLSPSTAKEILVQALLDAPMFQTRWRWNANRSLAVLRRRGGKRNPANIQRMEAEDLIASVFPDSIACFENIAGDRQIPDHPLVRQTIEDCLVEAMDIEGLLALLGALEGGRVAVVSRDLPEPSPLSHEILSARPYAFLDNVPLEERRARAVYLRRSLDAASARDIGALDPAAIARVRDEAWPAARDADEMHDVLMLVGALTVEEAGALHEGEAYAPLLEELRSARRATRIGGFWAPAERLGELRAVHPGAPETPALEVPARHAKRWEADEALRELVRSRLEVSGPVTAAALAQLLGVTLEGVDVALAALEAEGFALRGHFEPAGDGIEWCERRLLARIHRLTLNRLRAEIEAVSAAELLRFLVSWQRLEGERRAEGRAGLEAVLALLDGYELAAAAWETDVLPARVLGYDPRWLDELCLAGRVAWGRLSVPAQANGRVFAAGPLRSSPMALARRENLDAWIELAAATEPPRCTGEAEQVLEALRAHGALFFAEIARRAGLLPSQVETALGELSALGLVTSDSFAGLRALLIPAHKRQGRRRGGEIVGRASFSIESAGRWSLWRRAGSGTPSDAAVETQARALLLRYGVVFRRLLERESSTAPWRDLARVYRRLEARGDIRGGHFVKGFSGEQFALPEAVGLLRALRRAGPSGAFVTVSAVDPLNLTGIVTPGDRVPAVLTNRLLLKDGLPVAALEAGEVHRLDGAVPEADLPSFEAALRRKPVPARLRRWV